MTSAAQTSSASTTELPTARLLVGYDGSLSAGAAIDVGATLIPGAQAWIGHLWTSPFASEALRRRLWKGTAAVNDFVDAIEREGAAEANRLATTGVILAVAAGGGTAQSQSGTDRGRDAVRACASASRGNDRRGLAGTVRSTRGPARQRGSLHPAPGPPASHGRASRRVIGRTLTWRGRVVKAAMRWRGAGNSGTRAPSRPLPVTGKMQGLSRPVPALNGAVRGRRGWWWRNRRDEEWHVFHLSRAGLA
jgi:hypothetical protein